MNSSKIALIITLFLLAFSSIAAFSPIGISSVTPWKVESLPCRTLSYTLELTNNEQTPQKYHFSAENYAKYIVFSVNDIEIIPQESKQVTIYATLPCSVSGDITFNLKIKPLAAKYSAYVQLSANIKPDYTREISVAPVSVCKGEPGKGSVHVLNPSATPNKVYISASLPSWMELQANSALLPPNSQADFNFSVYSNAALGDHSVGFTVKDFSGTTEVPFVVNVKNCDHEFLLQDRSILAVKGVSERFNIPVKGSGEFKLALQGPKWAVLETEQLNLPKDTMITVSFNVSDDIEVGDYDIIVLAQNGETVNDKIIVSVTGNIFVKLLREYSYHLLGMLALLALIFAGFRHSPKKSKDDEIEIEEETDKSSAFDNVDFNLGDNVKVFKKFEVNPSKKSNGWMVWAGAVLVLAGIAALFGMYFGQISSCLADKLNWISGIVWPYLSGAHGFFTWKLSFLYPYYAWGVYYLKYALNYIAAYWQYLASGLGVIIAVIGFDRLQSKGYFKRAYDYLFIPPTEEEVRVYEVRKGEEIKKDDKDEPRKELKKKKKE